MFAETEAVRARLSNPASGKPKKAVAATRSKGKKPMAKRRTTKKAKTRKAPARRTTTAKRKIPRTRGKARRTSRVMVRGKKVARSASTTIRNARRKSVTYRKYEKGGAAIILRAGNPADQPKMIAVFALGAVSGIGVSELLDRWIATRSTSQTGNKVQYGQAATASIHAKADGVRVFAQVAAGGLVGLGAYAARKKMPMLTAYLAGFAGAHLVKGGVLVMTDWVLPYLFKSKKAGDAGDRMFPDRQPAAGSTGRPRFGGAPRPFSGKPASIGPQATGSVGACGTCNRTGMMQGGCSSCAAKAGKCNCSPFPKAPCEACLRRVGETPGGERITPVPVPGPDKEIRVTPPPPPRFSVPSGGREPGDGRVPGDGGREPGDGYQPPRFSEQPPSRDFTRQPPSFDIRQPSGREPQGDYQPPQVSRTPSRPNVSITNPFVAPTFSRITPAGGWAR